VTSYNRILRGWKFFAEKGANIDRCLIGAALSDMSFIRHADVLKIANIAQLVNVIAPILTENDRCIVQSIY
jgi:alpha-N-arabinofuranosidase